jgi:hypothetical protein
MHSMTPSAGHVGRLWDIYTSTIGETRKGSSMASPIYDDDTDAGGLCGISVFHFWQLYEHWLEAWRQVWLLLKLCL